MQEICSFVRSLLTDLFFVQMYYDPNAKPWTSRSWAPPGYASRKDLIAERKANEGARADAEKGKDGAVGDETRHEKVPPQAI